MPATREKKGEILKKLIDQFGRSKSVVFIGYRGITVSAISKLRGNLRKADCEMQVAKKTLMRLAAKESKIEGLTDAHLADQVAATFCYGDEMSGIKILFQFTKDNEALKLLGGIMEGKVIGADVVKQYAKLPGKQELLAKLLGSMNAPLTGFLSALSNVMSGFARVLDAFRAKKESESPAAPEQSSSALEAASPAPETPQA